MNLMDLLQASRERQEGLRDWALGDPLMPVRTGQNPQQEQGPDRMAVLASLLSPEGSTAQRGTNSTPGSTYTGGTGDFNATHEGPGDEGLVGGQAWGNYDDVQRLANRIENKFGVDVGTGIVDRFIAGTNTPSEHSYGAAMDIMAAGQTIQDRINAWLEQQRRADKWGYSNILGYWNRPEDHSNHLHVGWLY